MLWLTAVFGSVRMMSVDGLRLRVGPRPGLAPPRSFAQQQHQGEVSLVAWEQASQDVLEGATRFCAENKICELEDMSALKRAWLGHLAQITELINLYDDVESEPDYEPVRGGASGSTVESHALKQRLHEIKAQQLKILESIDTLEAMIEDLVDDDDIDDDETRCSQQPR